MTYLLISCKFLTVRFDLVGPGEAGPASDGGNAETGTRKT